MYVDESIPSNFNKVAEYSDNYVVLVKESTLNSGTNYEAYYQYFNPSTLVVYTDKYKITKGDDYEYDVHYTNNQLYSYIDYIDTSYSLTTTTISDVSSDYWDRPDVNNINGSVFYLVLLVILIVNLATSLVHRGGIFSA